MPRRRHGKTVRLACPCGRNLADVLPVAGHMWASPRPGIRQAEHGAPGGLSGPFTYRWDCRCGRTWEIRGDRLEPIWRDHAGTGIVRLVLGHDVL
jgi:hypothetical protein